MDTQRLFGPFLGGRGAWALLILRVTAGLAFMFHGWPKIQAPLSWMGPDADMPGLFQALAAFAEFGGGLAWIIGLLTPVASFGIFCVMTVAVFMVHLPQGDPFVAPPGWQGGSYESALEYLAIAISLFLLGPGKFSLDAFLFGQDQRSGEGHGHPFPSSERPFRAFTVISKKDGTPHSSAG